MKTAVIYSGQARSFGETFPNQYDKLLRQLPDPEFFVSIADDEQANTMTRLWERFPQDRVHIEYVQQPTLPEPAPGPKWLQMYPTSATPQHILKQLWALNRAWDYYHEQAGREPLHEIVVRLRPDLAFMRFDIPERIDLKLRGLCGYGDDICYTPWWSRWGGVNDRVAILGKAAAEEYFTTFSKIERLMKAGCPLHPETLVDRSLRDGDIPISHTLATEFVAVRLDGSLTPFDPTTIDTVEYARSK